MRCLICKRANVEEHKEEVPTKTQTVRGPEPYLLWGSLNKVRHKEVHYIRSLADIVVSLAAVPVSPFDLVSLPSQSHAVVGYVICRGSRGPGGEVRVKGESGLQPSPGSLYSVVAASHPPVIPPELWIQKHLLLYNDKGGIRSPTIAGQSNVLAFSIDSNDNFLDFHLVFHPFQYSLRQLVIHHRLRVHLNLLKITVWYGSNNLLSR